MAGSFGRARSIWTKARISGTRCGPSGRTATHPELIFGNNTLNCYVNAHEVPGTGELCCTLISHGGDLNGPIALIDPAKGRFNPAAITNITPDSKPRYHMDWAQRECFRDPVPIARDYFLVSHAPQKHFALYVIDRFGNRELLYLDPEDQQHVPDAAAAQAGAAGPGCQPESRQRRRDGPVLCGGRLPGTGAQGAARHD